MNNTFNINRFGLLLKRQWLEFGKIYLITLLLVLGTIVGFYAFSLLFTSTELNVHDLNFREPFFVIFGFLFISIIASLYFAPLGQKSRATIDLMLPASIFEKFLSGVLFTSVLSTLSFIVLFFITDFVFISTLRENFSAEDKNVPYIFSKDYHEAVYMVSLIPFLVTSIFLLGSIYFNRFHYIKTAVVGMVFGSVWTYLFVETIELITKDKVYAPVTSSIEGNINGKTLFVAITMLITLVFWSITYVRLKEKEV